MTDDPTAAPLTQTADGPGHSAAASALGYLHQTRWGLLELLRQRANRPDASLTLEMHDDIAWEEDSAPVELKQLKLHARGVSSLGDASPDLWRTIGVWIDNGRPADVYGPVLTLVTNSMASQNSAAALLRGATATRNDTEALLLLEAAAEQSTNQATEGSRDRFLKLDPSHRANLVSRIVIADNSPDLDGVDDEIADHLRPGAPTEHFDTYMELVWAWWTRISLALLRRARESVTVGQMLASLESIRDQFTTENLPALVDADEIDLQTVLQQHADRTYVRQLQIIGWQPRPIEKAILDYQRAFLQETRWLDRYLVDWDEINRFTRRLIDEWEREFDYVCGELPAEASEEEKQKAGRQLLHHLSQSALTIRARFDEPFFARGHRHGLADRQQIGWHPDFQDHLTKLLLEPAVLG